MALVDDLLFLVERATIETAYTPPIVLNRPFAPGPPNPILQALRPRITLDVAGKRMTMAPYGEPGPSRWPVVRTGLAVGAGALVFLAFYAYLKTR